MNRITCPKSYFIQRFHCIYNIYMLYTAIVRGEGSLRGGEGRGVCTLVRYVSWAHDSSYLLHGMEVWGETCREEGGGGGGGGGDCIKMDLNMCAQHYTLDGWIW